MSGVDGSLTPGGPALAKLFAVGGEGSEEKEGDEEQDDSHERKTEKGQGVAKDQPSLQARIVFCLQCHRANGESSC